MDKVRVVVGAGMVDLFISFPEWWARNVLRAGARYGVAEGYSPEQGADMNQEVGRLDHHAVCCMLYAVRSMLDADRGGFSPVNKRHLLRQSCHHACKYPQSRDQRETFSRAAFCCAKPFCNGDRAVIAC